MGVLVFLSNVEEWQPVFAGEFENRAEGHVEEAGAFVNGGILGLRFAEGGDDFDRAVVEGFGAGALV